MGHSSVTALRVGLFCTIAVGASGVCSLERVAHAERPGDFPLIARSVLFSNPDRAAPQLSPDGSKLAFIAPVEGVLNVWVGPAGDPDAAKPVTRDEGRGVRIYFWAYTSNHLIYMQDTDGDENWHVHVTNLTTGETKNLTPYEGVRAQVQEVSRKFPDTILVGLNKNNPQFFDLYTLNIRTGEKELAQDGTGFIGFLTDEDMNVRFAARMTMDGGSEYLQKDADAPGGWSPFLAISMEDSMTTSPIDFDKTGRVLYMIDSRDRNTAALVSLDLDSGDLVTLADDPRADVSNALVHPTEKRIQAVAFNYDRVFWRILDRTIEPDLSYLRTVADGDINVISRTLDDKFWIVAYTLDNGPVRYYRYDREQRRARFLFTNRTKLEGQPLARMHPVIIKSRDGLDLVSYLSLPPWTDPRNSGRPGEALPMVLLVHGGPWARDSWGYNSYHQWMANRGYAVLSVNFRGSTGFGKDFINASNHEWGAAMHDDLIDAVDWAIEKGVADPDRVAIMGGSYGGYATLVGLTFTPEVFACGVNIVGVSNLETLLNTIPPYWEPLMDMWAARVGDPRTDEGRALLNERSPLNYVDRIVRPLLIAHGANDPRVKQSESDQIVEAMQERDIPVTYLLYPDEGHGFARPENSMAFTAVAEGFLAHNLGGRYEPIGEDFEGSSITVPVGAADVPGLAESLPN